VAKTISHTVTKEFKFPTSKIEFWNNGIVFLEIQPNTEIDLDISVEHFKTLQNNQNGSDQYYILVDPGKFTTLTKEAREFSAKPESNAMTNAVAVIIHSLAQRIIINFHSRFISRQKMKMKAFQSQAEAMEWLLQQMKNHG
jgi:hypothetical protein